MPPPKDPVTGKFLPKSAVLEPGEQSPMVLPGDEPKDIDAKPEDKGQADDATDLAGAQALVDSWLTDKPSKVPEKKVEKPKKAEDTKATGVKPDGKPTGRPKAAPRTEPRQLTAADIAAAAAEGVARAMPRTVEKEKAGQGSSSEEQPWLTTVDKRRIDVLSAMEKMFPDRYKGIAGKYKESKKKLVEYASNWEKEHPGQEFDESAADHEEFFDKNDVNWEDEDYLEAIADLKAQQRVTETNKETTQRLTAFERKEKLRESLPLIDREQGAVARQFWKLMGEDYADVISEQGLLNVDKYNALRESEPVLFPVRVKFAEQLDTEVAELCKLMGVPEKTDPLVDYDDKNPTHVELANFAISQEDVLAAAPPEDQRNASGQMFMRRSEYLALPKEQRAKHWTFSAADLSALRAKDLTAKAQKIIEAEEEKYRLWAKSRGISLDSKSQKQAEGEGEEHEESSDTDESKPISPSAGGESKLAAGKSKAAEVPRSGPSAFVSRSF